MRELISLDNNYRSNVEWTILVFEINQLNLNYTLMTRILIEMLNIFIYTQNT